MDAIRPLRPEALGTSSHPRTNDPAHSDCSRTRPPLSRPWRRSAADLGTAQPDKAGRRNSRCAYDVRGATRCDQATAEAYRCRTARRWSASASRWCCSSFVLRSRGPVCAGAEREVCGFLHVADSRRPESSLEFWRRDRSQSARETSNRHSRLICDRFTHGIRIATDPRA